MGEEMTKAYSVDENGAPDGFEIPNLFSPQVAPDGTTRILVSAARDMIEAAHKALVGVLDGPLGVRYVQLIDRRNEKDLRENPRGFVALDKTASDVEQAIEKSRKLLYDDARSQLWIKGLMGDQIVLDELGMLYAYPDDPSFRNALSSIGINEGAATTLADRDFVKVEFEAGCDQVEDDLILLLRMVEAPE
tara:strand:+ start:504 stop:1076 length:573 start_codon:yes stop_codon:yes gene_type:complete